MGKSKQKKKEKLVVSFDDNARCEYISGFRKRRTERKLKAQKEIQQKLKNQIRQEKSKRRKATQDKVEEILKGIQLPDKFNVTDEDTFSEKVDFGTHEVFVKTDIDFSDAGRFVSQTKDESIKDSEIKNKPKKGGLTKKKIDKRPTTKSNHKRRKKQ